MARPRQIKSISPITASRDLIPRREECSDVTRGSPAWCRAPVAVGRLRVSAGRSRPCGAGFSPVPSQLIRQAITRPSTVGTSRPRRTSRVTSVLDEVRSFRPSERRAEIAGMTHVIDDVAPGACGRYPRGCRSKKWRARLPRSNGSPRATPNRNDINCPWLDRSRPTYSASAKCQRRFPCPRRARSGRPACRDRGDRPRRRT